MIQVTHKAECVIRGVRASEYSEGLYDVLYENPYTLELLSFTTSDYEPWKIGATVMTKTTYLPGRLQAHITQK